MAIGNVGTCIRLGELNYVGACIRLGEWRYEGTMHHVLKSICSGVAKIVDFMLLLQTIVNERKTIEL